MRPAFTNYVCWQQERIGAVISKLALSVDRAEFLATHVPMRRIAYERSPQQMTQTDETSLLEELSRADHEDRHVFAVVKGIPGTGKSHLIRWLKEQYALSHPSDAVLLIARANTSLRGTIQQIIDSRIFEQEGLPEPLQRLQGAVDVLSQDLLGEKLLNGLQEATQALEWDTVQARLGSLSRRLTPAKIDLLLLDRQVRDLLKADGGPIDRVVTFLASGTGTNAGVDRLPGFEPNDLDFDAATLSKIRRESPPTVHSLCQDMHTNAGVREDLARYLNHALHTYAISSATNLASGSLVTMFQELRAQLRAQGRHLALFIEDITALTGIDEGLIEVLISEHRGDDGARLCRLASVVGVADQFYTDRFPDNVKERVTHLLTLNYGQARQESDLLREAPVRAEFAARYLNAMRVSSAELRSWADRGGRPEDLPNACPRCPFQHECHASFGAVALRDDRGRGPAEPVGLYPFNQAVLDTLYNHLKEGWGRTPRTFLSDQLAYILQSHGEKVRAGLFPPPLNDLVPNVDPPTFTTPADQRIVEREGGADSERLFTLLLFWGDRSAASVGENGTHGVGNLPPGVFGAFALTVIRGRKETGPGPTPPPITPPITPPVTPPPVIRPYLKQIQDWHQGAILFGYDRRAENLASLMRTAIDWEAHGISPTQVRDYVMDSRIYIEGQSGSPVAGRMQIRFGRSAELRDVLLALAALADNSAQPRPAEYGEYLATVSHWIRKEEPRIVAFVREPTGQDTREGVLLPILLKACVGLAVLDGSIAPQAAGSTADLYQQVILSCARSTAEGWRSQLARVQASRPGEWAQLMRRVDVEEAVHTCRTELLQLLNRPQGASTNVRYLDAAAALNVLAGFTEADWCFEPLKGRFETRDRTWSAAFRVYEELAGQFAGACRAAQQRLATNHEQLASYLGESTPTAAFDAIRGLLGVLKPVWHYDERLDAPFRWESGSALAPDDLDALLTQVAGQLAQMSESAVAAGLSASYVGWQASQAAYLEYFDLFDRQAHRASTELGRKIEMLRSTAVAQTYIDRAKADYRTVAALLAAYGEEGNA
jgi:hypothetical protein